MKTEPCNAGEKARWREKREAREAGHHLNRFVSFLSRRCATTVPCARARISCARIYLFCREREDWQTLASANVSA